MKVGIIGAGIAGLTAAYRLSKKGINSILFEKESNTGGKVEYAVSITTPSFQPRVYKLIEELGLKEAEISFLPTMMGMLLGGEILNVEDLNKMVESLPQEEKGYFQKVMGEVMGSSFDIFEPSPRLLELRNISFEEYLKDCPLKLRKMFFEPMMGFTFMDELDITKFSAEYGLFQLRFGMEIMGGRAHTFEENVKIVTNVLEKKIIDSGSEVKLSSEVKKIEKVEKGFKIHYEKFGEISSQQVDRVVITTPLFVSKRIFPLLKLEKGVFYEKTKCSFVRGILRTDKTVIMGMPQNEANIRMFFVAFSYEHQVYPMDKRKPIKFDILYDDYKVFREKELEAAFPILVPKGKAPDLKTNVEGVFLCGDFYYYPTLDTAVRTAERVADLIG